MSFLRSIWQDMRARKLVPVAALLVVAIVAVPVVLSSSSSAPAPGGPIVPSGPVTAGLPAVSDSSVPSQTAPKGHARDPFGGSSAAGTPGAASTTTTAATPVTGSTTPSTGSTGAAGSTGGTGSTTTPGTGGHSPSGPTKIPTPKPKPTTPALTADQSYAVSLAITNSAGGLDTFQPLERLSPLPGASRPLLIELGVLKGGRRALFAVQPGTVVSGPGECIPGPIDCEILSLAQEQTETLGVHTAKGNVNVALFAVTAISAVNRGSHSAALTARNRASATGRRVLNHSSLNALSLFQYSPSVGAVVDLRNLTLRNS